MKNIQVIDGADNCVYDIFSLAEEDFVLLFGNDSDIAFIEDLEKRADWSQVSKVLERCWARRTPKKDVTGIHGTIFYGLYDKKKYYPTLLDEEAVNPFGSRLR